MEPGERIHLGIADAPHRCGHRLDAADALAEQDHLQGEERFRLAGERGHIGRLRHAGERAVLAGDPVRLGQRFGQEAGLRLPPRSAMA
jgi:hypothetical protein